MLTELKVSNFAIIENLHIQFQSGLNIISGETGAGKSVLLRSLSLLMGAKASSEFIRTGSVQAQIEGHFDLSFRQDIINRLSEIDIPDNGLELVVRRIIGPGDKNKVYLNGCLSTVGVLRDIVAPLIEFAGRTPPLIELTGQHENKNLLSSSYHLDLLDQYAKTWPLRLEYEKIWNALKEVDAQMDNLEERSRNGQQRIDYLTFQRDEIVQCPIKPGEEIELEQIVKRLKNRQRLGNYFNSALSVLDDEEDSVITRIKKLHQKGTEFIQLEDSLKDKLDILEQISNLLQDSYIEFQKSLETLNRDDFDLEELEEKLSQWRKLQKKYGFTFSEINNFLIKIETEISEIQNLESVIKNLRKNKDSLLEKITQMSKQLHELRLSSSKSLSKKVNEELKELNMKGVIFGISVNSYIEPTVSGISMVEFQSQTSSDDPPRPLNKVSSGGELSRILLSLKTVMGASTFPRTYLFDEVDSGVSGNTAEKVARKLYQISLGQQVICVTHLPQVAAIGNHHFSIQKSPKSKSVHMEIFPIDGEERIREIARLISGEHISKTSLAHAKELLDQSIKLKKVNLNSDKLNIKKNNSQINNQKRKKSPEGGVPSGRA